MTTEVTPAAAGRGTGSARASARAGESQGMAVLSYVIGGVLVYGGLGWLGWHFLHQLWMMPAGVVLGMGLSVLMVIRRYARADVMDAQIKELVAERDRQREHWTALARRSDGARDRRS